MAVHQQVTTCISIVVKEGIIFGDAIGSRRQHGLVVRRFRVRVLLWRLAGFVLCYPKFKS